MPIRTYAAAAAAPLVAVVLGGCTPQPWVVESVGYHGPRGAGTYYVACVPASDAARAYSEQLRWREVGVTRTVADTIGDGARCPSGPVLMEVGG